MTMPIPFLKSETAAAQLARAWVGMERTLSATAAQAPALLLVMPPTWNNRYQSLLYTEGGARRYAVMGVVHEEILEQVSWPGPIVFHAHWFSGYFAKCCDEIEAMERFEQMRSAIERFQARTGAKLLWTAHNVFPHGNRFPRTFMKLRQWLFETFDGVHIMQPGHLALLEDAFGLKAPKAFVVPHMTYDGAQACSVSEAAAKAYYEIPPDAFVFAYFGSIHPYKNLDRMLTAFERIAAEKTRPVAAIIAGVPSDAATVQRLQDGWGLHPQVRLLTQTVPDHEIQYIHRAADVMVLPYAETLNSGAAFMAVSFERPILMSSGLAAEAMTGLGVSRFDADTGVDGLEAAMRAAMAGERGTVDPAVRARLAPTVVSNRFFDELNAMIGRKEGCP